MHALAAALNGDQSCVEVMRAEFERRGKFLSDRLNALDGVVCPEPGGAFYAFPDVSGTFTAKGVSGSTEWAGRLLEDAHVGVVPGSDFGADACVRLSFATSMAALETALDRIAASHLRSRLAGTLAERRCRSPWRQTSSSRWTSRT